MISLWTVIISINGVIYSLGSYPTLLECASEGFKAVHYYQEIPNNSEYYCTNERWNAENNDFKVINAKSYLENVTKNNKDYNSPEQREFLREYLNKKSREKEGDGITGILGILGALGG